MMYKPTDFPFAFDPIQGSLLDFDVSSVKYGNNHLPELSSSALPFSSKEVGEFSKQAERWEQTDRSRSWIKQVRTRTSKEQWDKSPVIQSIPLFRLDWLSQMTFPLHPQLTRKLHICLNVEIDSSDDLRVIAFFFNSHYLF